MAQLPLSVTGTASRAYKSGTAVPGGPAAPIAPAPKTVTSEHSFSDMVSEATQSAVATVRKGDAMGQAGMMGKADPQAVVEATLAMEGTLKTVVSVRDKLVSAYQEVLRMPI